MKKLAYLLVFFMMVANAMESPSSSARNPFVMCYLKKQPQGVLGGRGYDISTTLQTSLDHLLRNLVEKNNSSLKLNSSLNNLKITLQFLINRDERPYFFKKEIKNTYLSQTLSEVIQSHEKEVSTLLFNQEDVKNASAWSLLFLVEENV